MELQVLGSVEAFVDGRSCALGPAKHRQVLAVLLLAKGQPVAVSELIDKVWEENPPPTARALLHSAMSKLRRCLNEGEPGAAGLLTSRPGGYQAQAASEHVDLYRFWELRDQAYAHVERDRTVAAQLFRKALEQWGGDAGRLRGRVPLADLTGRWVESTRVALRQQRHEVLIAYLETELHLGNHSRLVSTLTDLADDSLIDEQIAGLLMVAHYRAGSPASALQVFERTRQRLAEVLGADPSKELKELHQQVMNQDPVLDLPKLPPSHADGNGHHLPAPGAIPGRAASGDPAPASGVGSSDLTAGASTQASTPPNGVTKNTMMRTSTQDVGHEMQEYAMVVIDIEGFGMRSASDQKALRQQFYKVVYAAFDAQGIRHRQAPHQDLGDGAFWLLPGSTSRSELAGGFINHLRAGMRDAAQDAEVVLRLRVAFHSGGVERDSHGWVGPDLTTACRLVGAQPLRDTLTAARRAQLALIISRQWHDELASDGAGALDGSAYRPVGIEIKELDDVAWIRVPGYASPPGLEDYPAPPSGARPSRDRPRADSSTRKAPKPDPAAAADQKHIVVLGGRHAFTGATVTADQVTGGDSYEIHLPEERR